MSSGASSHLHEICITSTLWSRGEEIDVADLKGAPAPNEVDGFLDVSIDGRMVIDHVNVAAFPLFWSSLVRELTNFDGANPSVASVQNEMSRLTLEPVRGERVILRMAAGGEVLGASHAVDRGGLVAGFRAAARRFFEAFEPFDRDGIGHRSATS